MVKHGREFTELDKKMTEPKLNFDIKREDDKTMRYLFDSTEFKPDDHITIDLDKKLILTRDLTAYNIPIIYNHIRGYFKLLEYAIDDYPIIEITSRHYRMKNGWKITLRHWWVISPPPPSERYYAHDIHVPRFSREKHGSWTNDEWRTNMKRFDYLEDDYDMVQWINNLPKGSEEWKKTKRQLTQQEKDIIEFSPPEPETAMCPLCGDRIPDDTLRSPNILCEECHRPIACPTCKEEILKPVGITACPWCQSDPESTEKIKRSLRDKLSAVERKLFSDDKKELLKEEWLRKKFPGGIMQMGETTYAFENASTSSRSIPIESFSIGTDMLYPYRDKEHKLGEGNWGGQNLHMLTRNMGFDHRKEDELERIQRATGRSTQRRLSAMNHFFDLVTKKPFMDKRQVLFFVNNQRMVRDTKRYLENLYMDKYNMGSGVYETTVKNINVMSINIPIRGYSPTLVVYDLAGPVSPKQRREIDMNVSIWETKGAIVIGKESIRELKDLKEIRNDQVKIVDSMLEKNKEEIQGTVGKIIIDGKEIPVSDVKVTVDNNIQGVVPGRFGDNVLVAGPTTTKIEVVTDREHKDFLGYAMGNPENGILGIVDQGGVVKVRLANPGKNFLPGDVVTIDDVLEREDPIHKLPVPAAMDEYKQRVANIAGIGFESDQKSRWKPDQTLGWMAVGGMIISVVGLIITWLFMR